MRLMLHPGLNAVAPVCAGDGAMGMGMGTRAYKYIWCVYTSTYIRTSIYIKYAQECHRGFLVAHFVLLVVCRSHCYDTIRLLSAVDQYVPMMSYDAWCLVPWYLVWYHIYTYVLRFIGTPNGDIYIPALVYISGIIAYVYMIWYSYGVFLRQSNDFHRSLKRCSSSSSSGSKLLFLGHTHIHSARVYVQRTCWYVQRTCWYKYHTYVWYPHIVCTFPRRSRFLFLFFGLERTESGEWRYTCPPVCLVETPLQSPEPSLARRRPLGLSEMNDTGAARFSTYLYSCM